MINDKDYEKLIASAQTANLLGGDLRELMKASDLLLGDIAYELLIDVVKIEQRLKKLCSYK